MPGKSKTDVDTYFDLAKPYIKTLNENQLKEMVSVDIIMTLWVLWKKPIKRVIKLGPDDTTDEIYYEKKDMLFNSLMTSFLMLVISMILCNPCLHTLRHRLKILSFLRVVLH